MAKIGSFGGVTFEVSSSKVLTFKDFTRNGSSRWSTHDINLKKPIPEFVGPGQESIGMNIILNAHNGLDPETELNKLRDFRDNGEIGYLVIGTQSVTQSYWYIDNISETHNIIDAKGRHLEIEANLTLKEYPKLPPLKVIQLPANPTLSLPKPTPVAPPAPVQQIPKAKPYLGIITIKVGMLNCRAAPSLTAHIIKVLRLNQRYTVYGTKTTDIPWYDLGGGMWCSAVSKYTSFQKA